ncbi:MAG: amidohydrolase family protein, partial [Candidatus Thermoplasmatota archaeon]
GIKGINQIKKAMANIKKIKPLILSRPEKQIYDKEEINQLLEKTDGIGESSISDWNYSELKKIADHVNKKRKKFGLHASEGKREDIDKILDLKPDFLVHMNKAKKTDLELLKQENIPLVVCPRSNNFFNIKTRYKLLKETDLNLVIGTDNCMINYPSIINEIKYIKKQTNVYSLEELLKMVTYNPRKVLNHNWSITPPPLFQSFVVLDKKNLNILYIFRKKTIG